MQNYTVQKEEKYYIEKEYLEYNESGYYGEAATRLARFEKMVEDIKQEQIQLSKRIEEYKLEGRAKSYQCRELMAKKLTNVTILNYLKQIEIIE